MIEPLFKMLIEAEGVPYAARMSAMLVVVKELDLMTDSNSAQIEFSTDIVIRQGRANCVTSTRVYGIEVEI